MNNIADQLTSLNDNLGTMADLIEQIKEVALNLPEAGSNPGGEEGIEALGVLCDWQVMTDRSSFPIVTIINYHPMYYLHCNICFDGEAVPFVVPPADSTEGAVASYSWADYGVPFSDTQQIDIQDVRWSANE
jgi:hypothetical protein